MTIVTTIKSIPVLGIVVILASRFSKPWLMSLDAGQALNPKSPKS